MPVEVKMSKKKTIFVEEDEGVTPCTAEGLAKLKALEPGGIHSFGSQTHPADGNAGFIVTTRDKAKELSADKSLEIQIVSYGFVRAKQGFMPAAPVPATQMALERAELDINDVKAIKTHNPFIVNDINMAKNMAQKNLIPHIDFFHAHPPFQLYLLSFLFKIFGISLPDIKLLVEYYYFW